VRRLAAPADALQRVADLDRSADAAATATVDDRVRLARGDEQRLPPTLHAREQRGRKARGTCRYMRRQTDRQMSQRRLPLHAQTDRQTDD
jgi:hypothetical protein